ncbi:DNA repair protein RecO OS=Lysinibacillus sphaericus OX=1421 GN=recO PE=3 SV=1 [Lysinibacillus sphaericus]
MRYGESNKIVTLLTREAGKVATMARGAKKPSSRLSAVTQPFTYGMFMVQHHTGMGTLQQGEHLNSMRHIREDIIATAYASYIMELVERVVEEGKAEPFAFEVLLQALQAIEDGYDPEAITLFVEWKMLLLYGCATDTPCLCFLWCSGWGICLFFCTRRFLMPPLLSA